MRLTSTDLRSKTITRIGIVMLMLQSMPAHASVSFIRDVAPIVLRRCVGCHGDKINLGGYRANTFQFLMKRTASGALPVTAGNPGASALFELISTHDQSRRMPKGDEPLSVDQITTIRRWIAEGATFDGADPSAPLRSVLGPRAHPAAPVTYRAAVPVMAIAIVRGSIPELVAVGGYNEVTLWNVNTGAMAKRIGRLPQRIQSIACSAHGRRLLVAGGTPGEYGEISVVDIESGGRPVVIDTFPDIALSAVYNKDETQFAVGAADGGVTVYDAAARKRLWRSNIHSDWVTSVSFSSDGKYLASASRDMTVKLHNVLDGSLFTTYMGHCRQLGEYKGQDPVYSVQFIPDSSNALSAGSGKWIQLWNPTKTKEETGSAADMEERFARQGHAKYIAHGFSQPVLAMVVNGSQLFAASADGSLKQFDLGTLKEVQTYIGHSDWVYSIDYSSKDDRLVSGAFNGEVRIWDAMSGRCFCTFLAQPGKRIFETYLTGSR